MIRSRITFYLIAVMDRFSVRSICSFISLPANSKGLSFSHAQYWAWSSVSFFVKIIERTLFSWRVHAMSIDIWNTHLLPKAQRGCSFTQHWRNFVLLSILILPFRCRKSFTFAKMMKGGGMSESGCRNIPIRQIFAHRNAAVASRLNPWFYDLWFNLSSTA